MVSAGNRASLVHGHPTCNRGPGFIGDCRSLRSLNAVRSTNTRFRGSFECSQCLSWLPVPWLRASGLPVEISTAGDLPTRKHFADRMPMAALIESTMATRDDWSMGELVICQPVIRYWMVAIVICGMKVQYSLTMVHDCLWSLKSSIWLTSLL